MNGQQCGHDICAICLDPPTPGGLALACRHSFHAECLLASFQGETPGQWKCPCCRALVCTRLDENKKSSSLFSSFIKSTSNTTSAAQAEVALPGDFESLVLPPNIHYYRIENSKWATLQAFLTAAACALDEQRKHQEHHQQQQHSCLQHTCARSQDHIYIHNEIHTSSFPPFLAKTLTTPALRRSPLNQGMAIAERLCPPTAASITAYFGHAQLQRLLDPSLPHPLYRFIRYIFIFFLSFAAICFGVWSLRLIMFALGIVVCAAADATTLFFGVDQMDTMCVPMIPDTWALPIGFAGVGLYISVQIAVIAGVTLRHVLLKWDEKAWGAIGLWFLVCLGYTFFVYFARYLLTVVVSCLVPFPISDGVDGVGRCVPTILNPCY